MLTSNSGKGLENFGIGRHKLWDKSYSLEYFVKRVANDTGYSKNDIRCVLNCLQKVFEDCLVDVVEQNVSYSFGPFEFYGKYCDVTRDWKNPKTGEIIKVVPHVIPQMRIRPRYRKAFSMTEMVRRAQEGYDIDGTPINK